MSNVNSLNTEELICRSRIFLNTYKSRLLHFVTCCLLVMGVSVLGGYLSSRLAYGTETSTILYFNAVEDFSDTQDYKHWYYMYNLDKPMIYGTNSWNDITWHDPKGRCCGISYDWMHPGCDGEIATRKWISPASGEAHIYGKAHMMLNRCGNGVTIGISHNQSSLWRKKLAYDDTSAYSFDLRVEVETDDTMFFTVAADGNNLCDSTSFNPSIALAISNPNQPPVARFSFSPSSPKVGELARFDATASSDSNGSITSYEWTFGDGTTGSGKLVTHDYDRNGTFTVALTITDDDGASASTSQQIEVVNWPPQGDFSFTTPSDPCILDEVHFTDRSSDPDGNIVSWEWNFDDGTTSDKQNPTHRYKRKGTFAVQLTVTDNNGLTDKTTQSIVIKHKDLIQANFTFQVVDEILHKIHLDASTSIDTMGTIVRYEWGWDGDGIYDTAVFNPQMTHRFDGEGPYKVILTIVDDDGNRASCTKEVSP